MAPPLKFLYAAIFILAAAPRLNFSLGPVPIYAVDVCLLGAIWYGGLQRHSNYGRITHAGFVSVILGFALLSEAIAMLYTGTYIETVYMSARMCLSVSLFFLVNNLVKNEAELQDLLKVGVVGMLVTATLMSLTSLPGTRGTVAWIFGFDMLNPAGDSFFEANSGLQRGTRGQSLVGYNIISAWFVCLLWPMAMALRKSPLTVGIWQKIALAGCLLAPFGVLFSYSRGALLGLLLIIAALLLFGEGKLKSQIALAIIFVVSVIGSFGWDSNLFYFERIQRRTLATIENPFGNEMESERFNSYIDPFKIVADHPSVLFIGEGLTIDRVRKRGQFIPNPPIEYGDRNIADHSVFAMGTLKYGMIAALCYIGLLGFSTLRAYAETRYVQFSQGLSRFFPQTAFVSVFAMTAWVAFDKGIVMQPRGAMMFFLIIGLVGVSQNLRVTAALQQARQEEEEEEEEEEELLP